jgi:hypothetical protein
MSNFPKIIYSTELARIVRTGEEDLLIETTAGQDGLGQITWKKAPQPNQISILKNYVLDRLKKADAKKAANK